MQVFSLKGINLLAKIICVFCVLMILAGAVFAIYRWSYLRRATKTNATITNLIERKNDDGDTLFAPEYVFTDQNNNAIKIISSIASFPPSGKVGDQIEILYDPENPRHSIQYNFASLWGFPAVLAILGSLDLIFFGFVVFLTGRQLKRNKEQSSPVTSTSNHEPPQEIPWPDQ